MLETCANAIKLYFEPITKLLPKKHNYLYVGHSRIEVIDKRGMPNEFGWPVYQCQKCGKQLHLERWQINDLPNSMKYGCIEQIKD